ncbi:MAG: T9SS type A sorting domain-containing protein [Chitinophagales bacterium]|nr:T9SS type A sorting domain-containing protein [Chitinophagales bacterium]
MSKASIQSGCLLFFYFLNVLQSFSQSPGGVAANLRLWLRADMGTSCTADGCAVTTWTDQAGFTNATQSSTSPKPSFQNNITNNLNYNPEISFDGINDYFTVSDFSSGFTNSGHIFLVTHNPSADSLREILDYKADAGSNFPFNDGLYYLDFITVAGSAPPADFIASDPFIFNSMVSSSPKTASHFFNGTSAFTSVDNGSSSPKIDMRIGDGDYSSIFTGITSLPFKGRVAEVVAYNTNLTLNNRQKVETYLAIKYGITLSHDYINTSGIVTYAVATYNKNIIGIAREDGEDLLQKQSHTLDDTSRIYMNALASDNLVNATPPSEFGADEASLITGHDNGKMCSTPAALSEKPPTVYSRLEREWKVSNYSFTGLFNMDFKLNACASPSAVTASDLRLLVDADGNFSNATVYSQANGLTFNYSGGIISVLGISTLHIPVNTVKYITIASAFATTVLPIELIDFTASPENKSIKISWSTQSEYENDYFIVQRSKDGSLWENVSYEDGAGNSNLIHHYEAWDDHPFSGISYYRLQQVDYNKSLSFSEVVDVTFFTSDNIICYPNPTVDYLIADLGHSDNKVQVYVINSLGQACDISFNIENNQLKLSTEKLEKGIYQINIITDGQYYKTSFIKQ